MPMLNNLDDGEKGDMDDEFDFYNPNQSGGSGGIKKLIKLKNNIKFINNYNIMSNSVNSQIVSKIFRSKKNILDLLKRRGFNTSEYENFSINYIHVLFKNEQLDMLLTNEKNNKKIYVKYHLATKLRPNHVYDIIDDLYHNDEVLEEKDEFIIITKEAPNDTLIKLMENIGTR